MKEVLKQDVLKNFPIFGNKGTIFSLLRDYELFRKTIEFPGDIVIVGYHIAIPLLNFANFSEIQTIGDRTRIIYGFEGRESLRLPIFFSSVNEYKREVERCIGIYDRDRFVGWKKRIYLIRGGLFGVTKEFSIKNPGLKISLLYFYNIRKKEYGALYNLLRPLLTRDARVVSRDCYLSGD